MTDPNYTALGVLVDRSGSMHAVREAAQEAVNGYIDSQRALPGKCTVRLAHFDQWYDLVWDTLPIDQIPPYTLTPRGGTALLDAIGRFIVEFGEQLAAMPQDQRPGRVMVLIQTDGLENASKDWSWEQVNQLITQQRGVYGWEVVFLGAGLNAARQADLLGIPRAATLSYVNTGAGAQSAFAAAASYTSMLRSTGAAQFSEQDRQAANDPQGE